MATLEDVIIKLRQTADEIDKEMPVLLLEQEITAKSLVQDRIQETGKDYKGGQLGTYSNTKVPAFFFIGKGTDKTDSKLKVLAKEGKKLSYIDFKKLNGATKDYVDLTFSGQMWRETGVVQKQNSSNNAVIVIGQKSERSEKIAGYNEKRYGNFLQLNDEEIEIITLDIADGIQEIIDKNLNGL